MSPDAPLEPVKAGWAPLRTLALVAVGLALLGEELIRTGRAPWAGIGAELVASGIFAWGAWPKPAPPASAPPARRKGWGRPLAFAAALAGAIASIVWCLRLYAGGNETGGEAPWMAAILLVAAAGFLGSPLTAFSPRWDAAPPLGSLPRRGLFALAVVLILCLAAATRLPALDRIPFGINADEGDQAAVALSILRGHNTSPLFGVGWYHISIVYFRLLAAVMGVAGATVAGARTFGALCGIVTVVVVLTLGVRHFGRRAGLLAGLLVATLGPALQFSRETTCAGPTATLWTASALLFLEAARGGRAWAWILSGLAGGFSLYFYPTGRLWSVFALLFVVGLLATAPRGVRAKIFLGALLAALAALVIGAPFLYRAYVNPDWFVVRARETSIFVPSNLSRLPYIHREWPMPRVLLAQVERSIGIFNRFPDGNYFWPTGKPILPPVLSALAVTGLFASLWRIRDPRLALLTAWFWTGFVGVIVTVETPNLHRMATAVPVLAIFAALVLDDGARRFAAPLTRRGGRVAVAGLVAAVALALAARELVFYFGEYAKLDPWPYPRIEGGAIAREGQDAWVVSLAGQFHMVNSGWVYHLAPDSLRAGVLSPGFHLPLTMPANRDLAFLFYPGQEEYRQLVETFYPGGAVRRVPLPPGQWIFDVYRVPRAVWQATQGALVHLPDGTSVRVVGPGDPAPGALPASTLRWTAAMRVPSYGNYAFRVGPGPARLAIDGREILRTSAGEKGKEASLCLARGDHFVELEGAPTREGDPALLRWAPRWAQADTGGEAAFRALPSAMLRPLAAPPGGLFGVVTFRSGRRQERLDGTLATWNLSDEFQFGGERFGAVWTGALVAPASGSYGMGLLASGTAELKLDGRTVLRSEGEHDKPVDANVVLSVGEHAVELTFKESIEPARLEWTWTPPGGKSSIVPPSALRPPPGAGVGPPCTPEDFGPSEKGPLVDRPAYLRW
ncbi:MAG: PA14 domain-containing protein [Acidobacteriota bacterium]|nr:PA14 domain-containing protein [Acidobacteriota bacterium]